MDAVGVEIGQLLAGAGALAAATFTTARGATHAAEAVAASPNSAAAAAALAAADGQRHEMTITLRPGQAGEVKLDMCTGAQVRYVWQTSGGPVNFDTHVDPPNAPRDSYHGCGKGRAVVGDQGTLEAAFGGKYGWFRRNRGNAHVRVRLNTEGQYTAIKRVI